ncbi:efflux transporter outer membrane subunit [Pseudoduganella umbonata]|uniref:Efflux transporter outer membrane subunit n=1 Tax=Pseudoduganella umbonata TaxID=864828 RepID=A0A4V1EDK4_9BURK|nr:efflux transporter outer membrane subunit [Pseudoduganella umbonata]MBB3224225.1 multidrug efflux system outer membrane protein [Pseudoduganella umbonata]QCP11391.1 efflux transporter outer membrane subunit [Pseudoduganella umbonata]
MKLFPTRTAGALLAAGALSTLLPACSLAPKYERPAAPVAADFPASPAVADGKGAPPATADAKSAVDTGWREFFPDGRLQALIATALDNNRDLRTAALRIEEARAAYRVTRADRLPNVNAALSGTRARTPGFLNPATGQPSIGERFDAGLSLSSFELDFFGRVRSLSEAALATYLATDEARQAAQISLAAEVAKAYFTERAFAEQLALAQRTYEARRRTFELTQQRLDAGASSLLDLRSNETLMETARAAALALARQRAQAANALALLVGAPQVQPADASANAAAPMADDAQIDAMSAVPAGLPSDLITRRPDIRAAEQRLVAANANIGAARAAFFPRISLTAAIGSASPEFSQLFDGGNDTWSFVPQLTLPIFDAGRNRANLTLSEVRRNIAVADYERTIQAAFREVADALAARSYLGDQVAAQRAIQDAQAERLRLLTLRFENGVASSLDVLDAQRELFSAEQELVQARLLRTTSAIDLYRALGGGLR